MLAGVRHVADCVLQLLWPPTCAGCGTQEHEDHGFCPTCSGALLALTALPYCPRCGATTGLGVEVGEAGCGACPRVMFRFARLVRLAPFAGPVRSGVHAAKYRRGGDAGGRLGRLLAEAAAARLAEMELDVVLPVPMHWLRRLQRGRDHSVELARPVARRLGLPVGDELVRVRNTPPQVGLPASRRAGNVRGAFEARHRRGLSGARVLLVDDVMTTGSTMNEAARTLLEAGAERVVAAVIARAEPPSAYSEALRR